MASTLKYGSSGDEVKKLQETLNASGNYNLATDGKFGAKTQEAVKAYQKANGLSVDGIVGTNTWGALNKASTSTTPTTTPSATTTPSDTQNATTPKFEYADYAESDTVAQAKAMLDAQLSSKPGAYQSQWQNSLQETIDKIMNREKFSYDLNGDALYQQYKDQYTTQGQMAMMDTMGQAAALTGGYGNSYASTAGNQAYQGYLQQLNDRVPELYQLALDKYNQEGQDLLNQYALLGEQENRDYGRYRDTVSDWNTERDYLAGRYDSERSYDYGKYSDERSFDYGVYADEVNNQWKQKEFDEALRQYNEQMAYQKERDAVADSQWQQSYDLSATKASSPASLDHVATMSSKELVENLAAFKLDKDNEGLAAFLDDCVATGRMSESQADEYYKKYKTGSTGSIDTEIPPIGTPETTSSGGGGNTRKYQKHMLN